MMTETVRRPLPFLLLVGFVALAGCNAGNIGSFPALSPPVSSKADKNGLVTQIRPQVARISDSDPLQVVLHWEDDAGEPLTRKTNIPISWYDTCNTLTFHVTAPDGKKHTLKVQHQKNAHRFRAELSSSPTLFLEMTAKGIEVTPYKFSADWEDGPIPALEETGTYKISVSGELMPGEDEKAARPIPFASETVKIERGVKGYKPLSEIATIARERVKSNLKAGHETGGQVYDDANGNRLVHLTGPSSKLWHFNIYTVQVSPAGKVMNVLSREVSDCLAEGTNLEGEHGPVRIDSIREGDRLWGYDLKRGERVLTTVRAVRRSESNETLRLSCGLRVTGEHPVYASGRWRPARELVESDELRNAAGETVRVGKIERIRGVVAVFDLTVDEPNTFFAEGVLVHNKSRGHWPHLDDLWYRLWSPGARK